MSIIADLCDFEIFRRKYEAENGKRVIREHYEDPIKEYLKVTGSKK